MTWLHNEFYFIYLFFHNEFYRVAGQTWWLAPRLLHSDASTNKTPTSRSQSITKTTVGSVLRSVLLQSNFLTPPTSTTSSPAPEVKGQLAQFLTSCLWSHLAWLPGIFPPVSLPRRDASPPFKNLLWTALSLATPSVSLVDKTTNPDG